MSYNYDRKLGSDNSYTTRLHDNRAAKVTIIKKFRFTWRQSVSQCRLDITSS